MTSFDIFKLEPPHLIDVWSEWNVFITRSIDVLSFDDLDFSLFLLDRSRSVLFGLDLAIYREENRKFLFSSSFSPPEMKMTKERIFGLCLWSEQWLLQSLFVLVYVYQIEPLIVVCQESQRSFDEWHSSIVHIHLFSFVFALDYETCQSRSS